MGATSNDSSHVKSLDEIEKESRSLDRRLANSVKLGDVNVELRKDPKPSELRENFIELGFWRLN
jgi:hypothetical protein